MTVIIFILVLSFLVFIHELGHFLFAKYAGIRVDEFAIGFPPKIYGYRPKGSETEYVLNAIPFGGYVKIFGENGVEENIESLDLVRSFPNKPRYLQALVLFGGVLFNFILAWLLFSGAFMLGVPTIETEEVEGKLEDTALMIQTVLLASPAEKAGVQAGDLIETVNGIRVKSAEEFTQLIRSSEGEVSIEYTREGTDRTLTVLPREGVIKEGEKAIGVGIQRMGTLKLPFFEALKDGFSYTINLGKSFFVGIGDLIARAVVGDASINEVSGPVGIAKMSGEAASYGLPTLLSFVGFLSLNLAVLNILPFPALDGGRLLVLLLEAIRRKSFSADMLQKINGLGFLFLILLMIAVTVGDIFKLF